MKRVVVVHSPFSQWAFSVKLIVCFSVSVRHLISRETAVRWAVERKLALNAVAHSGDMRTAWFFVFAKIYTVISTVSTPFQFLTMLNHYNNGLCKQYIKQTTKYGFLSHCPINRIIVMQFYADPSPLYPFSLFPHLPVFSVERNSLSKPTDPISRNWQVFKKWSSPDLHT